MNRELTDYYVSYFKIKAYYIKAEERFSDRLLFLPCSTNTLKNAFII